MKKYYYRYEISNELFNFCNSKDEIVRILRLYSNDGDSWVGLYRILEAVESSIGGWGKLKKKGWVEVNELKRLMHTSQLPSTAGDGSRHGKETSQKPKNPMKLSEAKYYVWLVLIKWLEEKYGKALIPHKIDINV